MNTSRVELVHHVGDRVDVLVAGRPLFSYRSGRDTDPWESPKPYIHPLRTLGGEVVSGYRPHDHVWHKGLQMTAHLSGQNFWGGTTYVRDRGYVELHNQATMDPDGWESLTADDDTVSLREHLTWHAHDGSPWVSELRTISAEIDAAASRYTLTFNTTLRNIAQRDLEFTSPATQGLTGSGYGGFFWRGPRSFTGGEVFADGGLSGQAEIMGQRAQWLAFAGTHDGSCAKSTLLFVDMPGNPCYPNEWFVRSEPFPCVCFPLAYSDPLQFSSGAELSLRYHVIVADGPIEPDDAQALVDTLIRAS
jgi:hypothetical protein